MVQADTPMPKPVNPTGTTVTAPHPHAPLLEFAVERFGSDSSAVHLLMEGHQRFWALASLTQKLGVPIHMAIPKVLDHPPQHTKHALATQLPQLFALHPVQQALAVSHPTSVASIMTAAGISVFNPTLTPVMDRILRGSHFFMETIRTGLDTAIQQGQTVGVEIEFTPLAGMTRDDAYLAIKARLEEAGHTVHLHPAKPNFEYGPKPGIFPTTQGHFVWNGHDLRTELLVATSSIMHTITRGPDDSKRIRAHAETTEGATEELLVRLAEALGVGSVDSVKAIMAKGSPHYTETRMYLLKDDDGDIAKIEVSLRPNGKALISGNNCHVYDGKTAKPSFEIDTQGSTDAERFAYVDAWLSKQVPNNSAFAKKVDRFGSMTVEGIEGKFEVVVEAHPDLELITPILTPDQGKIIKLLIEGLHKAGFEGTRAANVVGVHVHAGLPLLLMNPQGTEVPTIAPAVNLIRAFGLDAADITSAVPTDPNRIGFIHDLRPELVDLFHEPNYVTDPTDPMQILRVCADLVRLTRTKYTALNLDNYISMLLGAMIIGNEKEGIKPMLEIGQEADQTYRTTYDSPTHGRLEYVFQIVQEGGTVNIRLLTQLPDVRPTGKDGNTLPYVDMIRIKPSAWKKTAEARLFNTDLLDGSIATLDMQFVATYVARFAKAHLIPMRKILAMRQAMLAPATPPTGQAGYATVDAMTLGALSALSALSNLPAQLEKKAASIAKGGAVFLLGDIGSEAVLGNWDYFKTLSVGHIIKDYALLTAGGEPTRLATTAALSNTRLATLPPFIKSLVGRAAPLFGALSAQEWGNTGTIDPAHLPKAVATVMTASAIVHGAVTAAGESALLTRLAQTLRLAKLSSGPTFLGLAVTSVAEFAIIKTANHLMEEMANAEQLTTMTDAIGGLLAASQAVPAIMSQGKTVPQTTITMFQKELDSVIAALEHSQTLDERRVWAQFAQGEMALQEWRRTEMGRTLDGTFSYGEIEARYQTRMADLIATRKQALAALAVDATRAPRLPVDPAEDWATFVDTVDEDALKADVDMDGNSRHDDATPLRYQALLDRNTHVMVAQLKQFRADWVTTIHRLQNQLPVQPLPLQLAQR